MESISVKLSIPRERIHSIRHHESHAASAFYVSPFENATIVTLDGIGEWETGSIYLGEKGTIRKIQSNRYLEALTPEIRKHVFNDLIPVDGGTVGFGDFPYIQLMRQQRLRPIDSFGHRIAAETQELVDRPGNHRVVTVLGGSAAQGVCVKFEEMFSNRLERKLNSMDDGYRYTVLNYAISGQLVTDELLTFLFFCDPLKPEIVITFDGWNDLANGAVNDPFLINECRINYRYQDEKRAHFLNNGGRKDFESFTGKLKLRNQPKAVVDCYLNRLQQLGSLVKGRSSRFIACFQPCIYSKKEASEEELNAMKDRNNPLLLEIFENVMPEMYRLVSERVRFQKLSYLSGEQEVVPLLIFLIVGSAHP